MTPARLFDDLDNRIALDQQDGDSSYFHALTLKLEYLTKLVTSGVVACIGDDADRQRYSLEYQLLRADSLGTWVTILQSALGGQPARYLREGAQAIVRDLTQHAGIGDWRRDSVTAIHQASLEVGAPPTEISTKPPLHLFFHIGATLRNRSRGHGAATTEQCRSACPHLSDALDLLANNLALFRIPWVYLHRNLSGKYRVSPLLNDPAPFHYLKRATRITVPDGVYFHLDQLICNPFVFSDANVTDISVGNGAYKKHSFETLSYITNDARRRSGSAWNAPPGRLPPSETEGHGRLEILGDTFTNVPSMASRHVPRPDLEDEVRHELLTTERHPIVTLTGPGGIGKTTTAIAAVHQVVQDAASPYDVILWISARDVDLLDSGPKPVSPKAVTQRDIAKVAAALLEPRGLGHKGFDVKAHFQRCLNEGAAGPTLFVFDNFETIERPGDVYTWLDAYIRPPNKVLITTRVRTFVGDYHIEIGGMTESQAQRLIDQHARRLGVENLLSSQYVAELILESSGHPYVIQILLGDVARARKALAPKRVVASNRDMLRALFERTYNSISRGAQRVFLLLSSWRVSVPEVAVEAVLLRSDTARIDVAGALEELDRYSLVERVYDNDDEGFVSVPLAAAEYGKRKLKVSEFKVEIEHDVKLLREFGVGRRGSHNDAKYGVFPRIENLVKSIATRVSDEDGGLDRELPVLEFLASRVPKAYLRLAQLVVEIDRTRHGRERAKKYVRRYLEDDHILDRHDAWFVLADLCQEDRDVQGEVHALCEAAFLLMADQDALGSVLSRLNLRLKRLKDDDFGEARSTAVRALLGRVCDRVYGLRSSLTATNCSRLAWLCLNIQRAERAREVTGIGLKKEPTNEHCLKLSDRLYAY